jgi:sugar/nucleoside kinase (ribokinase family)
MNKVVTFGEIMLRLSPPGFQRFVQARSFDVVYGGGEANVAVSLAGFDLSADFVTRLPANDIGDSCLAFIRLVQARAISCVGAIGWAYISWKWAQFSAAARSFTTEPTHHFQPWLQG